MAKKRRGGSITISKKGASARGPEASRALLALMGIESARCTCGVLTLGKQGGGPPGACSACGEPLQKGSES